MSGLAKVPGPVLAYVTETARRLREDPADPDGLFARALIFAALGQEGDARTSIQQLARVAPRHPAVLRLRSNGDAVALEPGSSNVLTYVNECARRLEKNPKDPDALFARAAILATLGQFHDALETLNVLAKVAATYPAVWRLKARLYKEIGDLKTAVLCVAAAERFEREQEEREAAARGRPSMQGESEFLRRLLLNERR